MNITLIRACLFIILIASCEVQAQYLQQDFKTLGGDEGLSSTYVKSIAQDQYGFVWVATNNGLNKYDGYSFEAFHHSTKDSHSLPENTVNSIYNDSQGRLWIGMASKGICFKTYAEEGFQRVGSEQGFGQVDDFEEDSHQNIWVATTNGLYIYLHPTKELLHYTTKSGLPTPYIKDVFTDDGGKVWLAHDKGISLAEGDIKSLSFRHFLYEKGVENSLPSPYAKGIIQDRQNRYWVISDNGLSQFQPEQSKFIVYPPSPETPNGLPNPYLKSIVLDKLGQIWVGHDQGISSFDPDRKVFYNLKHEDGNPYSLSNNYVKSLFVGENNDLWVGTDAGLSIYDPLRRPFQTLKYHAGNQNTLSNSCVYGIVKDQWGAIWIGTAEGLNRIDPQTKKIRSYLPPVIPHHLIKRVVIDQNSADILWLATDGGLLRLKVDKNGNIRNIQTYKHEANNPQSMPNNAVIDILQDSQGRFWVSNFGEGSRLIDLNTGDCHIPKPLDQYDSHLSDLTLKEDSEGNIWFSRGIVLKKSGEIIEFSSKAQPINDFAEAASGKIWMASFGEGLGYFTLGKDTAVNWLTEKDGLPANNILGLCIISEEEVWATTTKGISRLNPQAMSVQNFDKIDGLPGYEFNIGAVYRDKNTQSIFFGGQRGMSVINPPLLQVLPPPLIYITSLQLYNQPVMPEQENGILKLPMIMTDQISVNYEQNYLTFGFLGLNYRHPSKIKYAYRMEGVIDEWTYTDASRRDITFSSLASGKYLFQVKAANPNGQWSDTPTQVQIIVAPPWWATPFAIALWIILTLAAIYSFYKVRVAMLESQKKQLEEQVVLRTKELQHKNEEIASQYEELQQLTDETIAQRDKIEEQHQALEQSYEDIVIVGEFGKTITGSLSLHSILQTVYHSLNELLDAPTFAIGVYNDYSDALEFSWVKESPEQIERESNPLNNENLATHCFKTEKSIAINAFDQEWELYLSKEANAISSHQSQLYAPLVSKGKRLGVVSVQSPRANAYPKKKQIIFHSLAAYVATALDNAQTHLVVREKNMEITSSIRYAQTIQQAVLPFSKRIERNYSGFFILYRPKDIVSGDFYWHEHIGEKSLFAVVDCTGHGVPGAFMSMLGFAIMNDLAQKLKGNSLSQLLEGMDDSIKMALKQGDELGSSDGMELGICCTKNSEENPQLVEVCYAGAKRPLYYTTPDSSELKMIRGNRRSIGGYSLKSKAFEEHRLTLPKGSRLYLSSDGLIDQSNAQRRKFGSRRLQQLLSSTAMLSVREQGEAITQELNAFQGSTLQRDDITLVVLQL